MIGSYSTSAILILISLFKTIKQIILLKEKQYIQEVNIDFNIRYLQWAIVEPTAQSS